MTRSTEGPDEALLAEAARVLGTTGRAPTIDRALATVIGAHRHREAVEAEVRHLTAAEVAGPPDPLGAAAAGPSPGPVEAPPGGWLLDTSARAASPGAGAAAVLEALLTAGRLVTCPLLDLEALATAGAHHRDLLARRHLAYRRVPLDDAVTGRALALQAAVAGGPGAAGPPAPRALLVVATASVHGLGVLHDDAELARAATSCGVPHRSVTGLGDGGVA